MKIRRPIRARRATLHRDSQRGSHPHLHSRRGFTLIEVLVALGIVAIALAAGAQATLSLTRNAQRQSDVLLAGLCGENELIRVRLVRQMPPVGEAGSVCTQAGFEFPMVVTTTATLNPNFRRVDVQVQDANAAPIVRLSTVVGRF